jgi:hypothetical protein
MEFLSQASFICLAETCRRACWQPAGVTVPTALPPWERVLEALPNCSVLFLSVTWYRRAAGPRKVCSFSQTMSKTDATPEKQNRQVAREKSYRPVTDGRNLFNLLLLKTWVKLARHSSVGSLYPQPLARHCSMRTKSVRMKALKIGKGLVGG